MSDVLRQILELARWAPSGDNTQPWRFEILADGHIVIHGFDTREHCIYDVHGRASQIALGALLETLSIAATGFGLRAQVQRIESPENRPMFSVRFEADALLSPSPLLPYIQVRAVQRRALRTTPVGEAEKRALDGSVGADYKILWIDGWRSRFAAARLLFKSAKIRLTTPEAFEVHRRVIEWNARFSADRIPDRAVGLDPMTLRLMRWAMHDWRRVEFLNTYLAGTLLPRIQLDFVPGLACAAHFVITAERPPADLDDYVAAGRAMQRFWLTATRLHLQVQPEMTPLIFGTYARENRAFSVKSHALPLARKVHADLQALVGSERLESAVFMGRIGRGTRATARSGRLDVKRLIFRQ